MIKTILIGRNRKTGKDELLAGSEMSNAKQTEAYFKFKGETNEEFSEINLVRLEPWKKPLKFSTEAEVSQREKAQAAAVEKNRQAVEQDGRKNKLSAAEIQDQLRIANQGHHQVDKAQKASNPLKKSPSSVKENESI